MNDLVLKIDLPEGFWTKIHDGRHMGTVQIEDALFRLEALEINYHRMRVFRKHTLQYATSVQAPSLSNYELFDAIKKLAGDQYHLDTIKIDHQPHIAYMTPYSKPL